MPAGTGGFLSFLATEQELDILSQVAQQDTLNQDHFNSEISVRQRISLTEAAMI